MKKILCVFLILIFSLGVTAFADDEIEEVEGVDVFQEVSSDSTAEPVTYSKHIICIERTTKEILFEKDAYTKTAMASTTKILTGIIAIEKCDLNAEVEISAKAAGTGGSTLGITANTKMTMESLLYGLLLRSGNDCAVAIAEYIGGDTAGFADIMNEKAKEIGLKNSHFVTPHGLDNEAHYTTAYDMACLTDYALNNEIFKNIVGTKKIDITINGYSRTLNNTNELLGNVSGVYGVKTGFTGNAGRCLVTACKRDNLDIIIVVLGADTKRIRGLDTKNVIDYVYKNFEMQDTKSLLDKTFMQLKNSYKITALKATSEISLGIEEKASYVYPVNKNKIGLLKATVYCLSVVEAPIPAGKKIGEIKVSLENNIFYSVNILVDAYVPKKKYADYMKMFFGSFKNYYKF
jgi:D-alanyl-D-alanine carboxypeptidase (penicillin-binding protein 5/6)